MDPDFGVIT